MKRKRANYDCNEFVDRLSQDLGNEDLAKQMVYLQLRYMGSLGSIHPDCIELAFGLEESVGDFRKRHDLKSKDYNPIAMARIFVSDLKVPFDLGIKFDDCFNQYIMDVDTKSNLRRKRPHIH